MPVHESDVCVIGGGITAAMLVERLAELKPNPHITVVEAGRSIFDRENRGTYHRRALEYGEHPWHGDYIEDQQAKGMISMTMAVGGQALHWGGACNRFSEEDLRLKSMYGLADDWPLDWAELESYYVQAERRLNVAGDPSPYRRRSTIGAVPAAGDAALLQPAGAQELGRAERAEVFAAADGAQRHAPFDGRGACGLYDTCGDVCPTGARYSPDYTYQQLIAAKKITLHDRTLVRKLVLADGKDTHRGGARRITRIGPNEMTEYRARLFVLASGQCWSPHLLLLSANSRFPNGIANRSGLVGRYMNGHKFISAQATIDDETFPGQNMTHSLISREYLPLRDRTSRSCGTTRACGRARPARSRGCAQPTARCCSATSCSPTGDRARQGQLGAAARLLRLASVGRQPADARSAVEESLRRSDAEDRAPLDAAAHAREGATLAHCTGVFERAGEGEQRPAERQADGVELLGSSRGRMPDGHRPGDERLRQLRPHARSREPLRHRRADAADRRLHQRHADVRRALAAVRASRLPRLTVQSARLGVLISGRGSNLKAIIDAIQRRTARRIDRGRDFESRRCARARSRDSRRASKRWYSATSPTRRVKTTIARSSPN